MAVETQEHQEVEVPVDLPEAVAQVVRRVPVERHFHRWLVRPADQETIWVTVVAAPSHDQRRTPGRQLHHVRHLQRQPDSGGWLG